MELMLREEQEKRLAMTIFERCRELSAGIRDGSIPHAREMLRCLYVGAGIAPIGCAAISLADEVSEYEEEEDYLPTPAKEKKRPGYIYLLRAADGHCKIGRAGNVESRVRLIGTDIPYKVETVHTFPVDDSCAVELELHKRFADKRANGEWFRLDAADVEYICSLGVPAPASD
jgi:hypothetical protein